MLPNQRNQMTMDILKKLREKGMPAAAPAPVAAVDPSIPAPGTEEGDETLPSQEEVPSPVPPDGTIMDPKPGSLLARMKRRLPTRPQQPQ